MCFKLFLSQAYYAYNVLLQTAEKMRKCIKNREECQKQYMFSKNKILIRNYHHNFSKSSSWIYNIYM